MCQVHIQFIDRQECKTNQNIIGAICRSVTFIFSCHATQEPEYSVYQPGEDNRYHHNHHKCVWIIIYQLKTQHSVKIIGVHK